MSARKLAPRLRFPDKPSGEECRDVRNALATLHGARLSRSPAVSVYDAAASTLNEPYIGCELQTPHTVLDSLVRTILSQNTTDITSQRAFQSLKTAFPDWELVRTAAAGTVEQAIKVGGLADIKAARIKAILNSLLEEHGVLDLEYLRTLPVEDIKQQLSRYKGVGPKTIACVLMFCLHRAEFPVDTHVWEISKQLGWVPATATREQTYEHLNQRVPDDIKYDLHVLMVEHGKKCLACGKRSLGQKHKKQQEGSACPLAGFKCNKGTGANSSSSSHGTKASQALAAECAGGTPISKPTAFAVAAASSTGLPVVGKGAVISPTHKLNVHDATAVGTAGAMQVPVKTEEAETVQLNEEVKVKKEFGSAVSIAANGLHEALQLQDRSSLYGVAQQVVADTLPARTKSRRRLN
eukprot:GHRR01012531.1.p1 GENE.GHRR01012531.1~~GHRR01012531.1.p1  ORF type:complete len:409 (+),score=103.16 GHRR01012531.1:906-2132(+)